MDVGYCWSSLKVHTVHEYAFNVQQNIYIFINNLAMSAFNHPGKVNPNVFLHFPISIHRAFGNNVYRKLRATIITHFIWVALYGCGFATHKRSSSYIQFYFGTNFNSFSTPFHAVLREFTIEWKLFLQVFKLIKKAITKILCFG